MTLRDMTTPPISEKSLASEAYRRETIGIVATLTDPARY